MDSPASSKCSKNVGNRANRGCKYCLSLDLKSTRENDNLLGNVARCVKCSKDVREELRDYLEENKDQFEYEGEDTMFIGSEDEFEVINNVQGKRVDGQKSKMKGPMDMFMRGRLVTANKKRKNYGIEQQNIKGGIDKEATWRIWKSIADLFYAANIPFNAVELPEFKKMIDAIAAYSYGPNLEAPTCYHIRGPLLKQAGQEVKETIEHHMKHWDKFGCSLMLDGWSDKRNRNTIHFLVNSSMGTVFIKSIDVGRFIKFDEKLFELIDGFVEEIGEHRVIQVITESGSNYEAAGRLLETKRPQIFWTPCATHCLDLILEDIGKIPFINKTIKMGITLVGFIYNHSSILGLMRCHTKRELVRQGITQFATSYLSLARLYNEKRNIQRMFTSDEWVNSKLSKQVNGKKVDRIVFNFAFWKNVLYILKVMNPLAKVFRLVAGEKKPAMGYIYEEMERAKETIKKAFKENEDKYRDIFKIINDRWSSRLHHPLHVAGHYLNPEFFFDGRDMHDSVPILEGLYNCIKKLFPKEYMEIMDQLPLYFDSRTAPFQLKTVSPASWWNMHGAKAPKLKKFAMMVLNLSCSAFSCLQNWSVCEHVHLKEINNLTDKKLEELLFVRYNRLLKKNYDMRNEIDPISLTYIDECNEWFIGEMNGEDLVFENDDGANEDDVLEGIKALGRTYNLKGKASPSIGDKASQRNSTSSAIGKGKGKKKVGTSRFGVISDDEEFEESWELNIEELLKGVDGDEEFEESWELDFEELLKRVEEGDEDGYSTEEEDLREFDRL